MSTTLRETFRRQADVTDPPDLDLDTIVARGDSRLRRRRWVATGGAAAAVAGVALALGLTLAPPVEQPTGPGEPSGPGTASVRRPLVWSDGELAEPATIHYGDQVVRTGRRFGHLDVTDDGVVSTDEQGVWFTDGGPMRRIASDYCGIYSSAGQDLVQTSATGSLVSWLDCAPGAGTKVVVFDTSAGQEVVRRRLPSCGTSSSAGFDPSCTLRAVVGEHVYVGRPAFGSRDPRRDDLLLVDAATGRVGRTSQAALDDDIRSQPRGLVLGRSWLTGTPVTGSWAWFRQTGMPVTFRAAGDRLVPIMMRPPDGRDGVTSAFDTATGDRLDLRLPRGYATGPETRFLVTQWLDDDTLVLVSEGDLLRCRLPDGRCVVAEPAPADGRDRVVPRLPLPG